MRGCASVRLNLSGCGDMVTIFYTIIVDYDLKCLRDVNFGNTALGLEKAMVWESLKEVSVIFFVPYNNIILKNHNDKKH